MIGWLNADYAKWLNAEMKKNKGGILSSNWVVSAAPAVPAQPAPPVIPAAQQPVINTRRRA